MPNGLQESDREIGELAAKIRVNRRVFEQLYDPIVEPKIPEALQFRALSVLREREEPGLKGKAKDIADFTKALRQARDMFLLMPFFANHADKLFVDAEQATVQLQVITNPRQPFPPGLQLSMGTIAALRRTCRIQCGEAKGTGFLVGPHLVLTNWHVVRSMLESNGLTEKPDSHIQMKFEFDVLTRSDGSTETIQAYKPEPQWLVASSPAHPDEIASGGSNSAGSPFPVQPNDLDSHLDFAVVALDGAPGNERGYYELDPNLWPQDKTDLDLFQHPNGRPMSYLSGQFQSPAVFANNSQPPRVLHNVNTIKGSSGGLCLNKASQAVALHQAGYSFRPDVDAAGLHTEVANINAAVPLAKIAQAAGATIKARIASAPRTERRSPKGAPIIGRRKLQSLIDNAVRGPTRIIVIRTSFDPASRQPRSKIGKSFSTCIIDALLPAAENVLFSVPAGRLTSDARTAARFIIETVNPQFLGKLPSTPVGQTTLDAEAVGTLVSPVIEAMCASAGNGVVWLVLDDLDRNPVLNASTTSTFLNALYKAAVSQSKVRIVLIGPTDSLPGLSGLPIASDLIEDHIGDSEVEAWIEAELNARIPVVPQLSRLMVRIARSVAEEMANDPLKGRTAAIAHVLQTHWAAKITARE